MKIQQLNNDVYVIKKEDKDKFNLENHKITEFEKYIVIEQKGENVRF